MLREPRKAQPAAHVRKDKKTGRFRIVRLEERIAPTHCTGAARGQKEHSGRCF